MTVNGTTFTANHLLPRKSYTFSVRAVSPSFGAGPPGNITIETSVLEGKPLLLLIK